MTRKPWFWIVFVLFSLAAGIFAFRYFPRAFPIVTLDLEMDRAGALEAARELVEERGWGPEEFRQAASFGVDFDVQSFVELEAGGTEAFSRMIQEGLYEAYTWKVRHFQEGVTREATVRFTPGGRPYGFVETLPEDEPGPAVSPEEAREIAESAARSRWEIDLDDYELVEQGREERPGGRVDHTLVYQRPDVTIGEGRYRLRLGVGGDRLTELTHFVEIPEAFQREYEEMRSKNQAISLAGTVGMIVFLLGGVAGLIFLMRRRWVLWRRAVIWGSIVAGLMALATLNQWPLLWMGYDTAVSAMNFTLQQLVLVVAQLLGLGLLYVVTFMTAESLSRRAFPGHVRLWKSWSTDVAATPALLGRTVGAYLLISFFWAYEVGLYFFTRETLGWWNPSSALFHPDALATYFPWLTSIAISLQAGFWEECLFRAIPIAGAVLLGRRYGRPWAWVGGAIVLQALVFGAGHAGYPAQPAYARLVELIIPSLGWAFLYLVFGLLPAIVLHFAIDVSAFAIPLFVSDASGAWIDQGIVVLLTLAPLWVVLAARLRRGAWTEMPEMGLNRFWTPPEPEEEPGESVRPEPETRAGIPVRVQGAVLALGILGLAGWLLLTPFESDAPPLEVGRETAAGVARDLFEEEGIEVPDPWRQMTRIAAQTGQEVRFVWQEGGETPYRQLLGTYLSPPHWEVRYARFEGDVAERAEEYLVFVDPEGTAYRFRHRLPEGRPGASLSEEAARELAEARIEERYDVGLDSLEEISAVPAQHPERKDWTFTFQDPERYPLEQGEARIVVEIAGERVVDTYRHVHVPEDWAREQRDRRTARLVVQIASWILVVLILVAGMVTATVSWSRRRFSLRAFLVSFGVLLVLHLVEMGNGWPQIVAGFSTAQPFELQLWAVVGAGAVFLILMAAAVALIIGLVHAWIGKGESGSFGWKPAAVGLALAAAGAGAVAVGSRLGPDPTPLWGSYQAAGTLIPLVQEALAPLSTFVQAGALLLLFFAALDRVTARGSRRRGLGIAGTALFGLALSGTASFASVPGWALTGVAAALALILGYLFVFRYDLSLVPVAVGGLVVLEILAGGLLRAHPADLSGSVLGSVLVLTAALVWQRSLGAGPGPVPGEARPEDSESPVGGG